MTTALANLDAAILYDAPYAAPPFPAFIERVNAALAGTGTALRMTNANGPNFAMFNTPDLYLIVSLNPTALNPEGFRSTLASAHTKASGKDLAARVLGHTGNIFLTVGDGPMHMTPEMLDAMQKVGLPDDRTPADFLTKIRVLHAAVRVILDMATPAASLIHWCQSDTLHRPQSIPKLSENVSFPVTLLTHPAYFSPGKDEEGRMLLGFVSRASDLFVGRTLILEPTWRSMREMVPLVDFLILKHLEGKTLTDGLRGNFDETSDFRLAFGAPDATYPKGSISIRIEPKAARREGPARFSDLRAAAKATAAPPRPDVAIPPVPPVKIPQPTAVGDAPPAAGYGDLRRDTLLGSAPPRLADPAAPTAEVSLDGLSFGADREPGPAANALLARLFTPDPEQPRIRYYVAAVALTALAPVAGIALGIATFLRGPMPGAMILAALAGAAVLLPDLLPLGDLLAVASIR